MGMPRVISPEWLDTLPSNDSRAIASRRDLRRLNSIMGHARFFLRELPLLFRDTPPRNLLEIGSGDGTFMLKLASKLAVRWPKAHVTLLDRKPIVTEATITAFESLGWSVSVAAADVFDWARKSATADLVLANLFLHHFQDASLRDLFQQIASGTQAFAACEPRRSAIAITASRLLGLIGCNDVTRHDGPISVQAGFAGKELSALWPASPSWQQQESSVGLFSHGFVARRMTGIA